MPRRSYDQYCTAARALDAIGERWTLLVVRELLAGPRRYTDLHTDLPGVSTDVLAGRLKDMERDGLVHKRRLPKPANAQVYELTERGRSLLPVITALAAWGGPDLVERRSTDAVRAHWFAPVLLALFAGMAPDADATVEVVLDEGVFRLRLGQDPGYTHGPAQGTAEARVETDLSTLGALASGAMTWTGALTANRVRVIGDGPVADALRTPVDDRAPTGPPVARSSTAGSTR
ncbi:winged helix-turn-helix transcriptional regulator [Nocardiopsis ansamitocini]|uniref:Transcriptional regulator n=1 Tax=Nocardiopsis ansamitocini TaxID=1670832 RepID=A0A9W6UJ42_9ACTN|nr:helix-turn-helix domain-containing protein [Nocardiopsis ansamitocini]GLU48347.1 transcriptional regulator [Nocardiopsis ansamitocini]